MSSLACLAHAEAYTSLVVGVLLKGFLLARTCQDKILETFILYHIPSAFFVSSRWHPEISALPFCSVSRSSFTPQELLVNLTPIPLLSLLSFSRMLLDWQGPALHALSFWLQAPPITTLCTHSYTHNAALLYGYGASANLFFFFSFSPLTAVVWVSPDKDSQKSWYQEGLLAIRTYILNSSPYH